MARSDFSDLADFVAVATHSSFRKAAVERGVSASALSHNIRALEERIGVRLLNRTTRSVRPSEAGIQLIARLRPAFNDIAAAVDEVNAFREQPVGTIRLNVPRSAASLILAPIMAEFLAANAGMHMEVSSDDRLVDIVAEGFDAGIRFGERIAQDMVAVKITPPFRFSVSGAPAYFKRFPMPSSPRDLHAHSCIRYRFPSRERYLWEFEKDGEWLEVDVNGPLTLDDQELMIEAALSGIGLAFTFEKRATPHIANGRLVAVLEPWWPTFPGLFLYYPSRRQMPAGLRAFIDLMRRRAVLEMSADRASRPSNGH